MAKSSIAQAYIQIIPTTTGIQNTLTKELSGAGGTAGTSAGSKFGSAFASGLKTVAKVGAAATVAATAAVSALTTAAVKGFAEYEQLAGGAEKIFDEMDISGIEKDAVNAFETMGISANQYLEAINSVGASFSATMGDEKGYNTAKAGLQAISDYASGTGKDIDVLNEKYQMITRSTSSYQSIADQFSGVLPATSAAFLEAAQSAGYLDSAYTSLTEVPIDEYQSAVTSMLQEGVDALGLTGNTAAEAAGTISGSMTALGAAWSNLVTGFANKDADLEELINNVVEYAGYAVENIAPVVSTALNGIGTLITEIAPIIADELPGLIENLLPNLLTSVSTLLGGLVSALPSLFTVVANEIPNLINSLVTIISSNAGPIVKAECK